MITVFLGACGQTLTATPSGCATGVVQISVLDTGIRRECGCLEAAGIFSGTDFRCTVAVGARVFFYYPGITQPHFITFPNGGATGAPQSHDPNARPESNPIDAITLNSTSAGIIFTDIYTGNGGTFIVQ